MKGKIAFYYDAPNVSKVRTRLDNPSKELTGQLREALKEAAIETLNENILSMRAKMIAKFSNMGTTVKDKKYADQLQNVMNSFFDVVFQATPFAAGESDEEVGDGVPAEEAQKAPAEKKEEDFD